MSKFNKIKNFGSSATVVSYAYFQAFKFPDSMNVHFQCVIQVCRFNCPDPVCPDDPAQASAPSFNVQASVTAAPAFGGDLSGSGPSGAQAPNEYVVNPRTPSVLPATRRNFRSFGGSRFSARSGREHDVSGGANPEMFSFSDANGMSFQHHYNMNNQYYQSYQNHRVKRHEEAMKKSSLGEVKTNSTFQVSYKGHGSYGQKPNHETFLHFRYSVQMMWLSSFPLCKISMIPQWKVLKNGLQTTPYVSL